MQPPPPTGALPRLKVCEFPRTYVKSSFEHYLYPRKLRIISHPQRENSEKATDIRRRLVMEKKIINVTVSTASQQHERGGQTKKK